MDFDKVLEIYQSEGQELTLNRTHDVCSQSDIPTRKFTNVPKIPLEMSHTEDLHQEKSAGSRKKISVKEVFGVGLPE